jgi:hypothetical protein
MRKNNVKIKDQVKFERVFEYDDCTQVWRYDNLKTVTGPYEVETKLKKPIKKV